MAPTKAKSIQDDTPPRQALSFLDDSLRSHQEAQEGEGKRRPAAASAVPKPAEGFPPSGSFPSANDDEATDAALPSHPAPLPSAKETSPD